MANKKRRKKNRKIVSRHKLIRYRFFKFVDPGVIVFFVLALYLCACMIIYFLKPHITTYEVNEGSMATDYSYTGIAIRSEEIVYSDTAGYITYYARDLEKTGAQTKVYSIDETGELKTVLSDDNIAASSLNDEQLSQLKDVVGSFYDNFSDIDFGIAYEFKQNVENTTVQLIQQTLIENAVLAEDTTLFHVYTNPLDGIISYTVDGFEGLTAENVTSDMLSDKKTGYEPDDLRQHSLVKSGDKVFKVITQDEWSIVIKTDSDIAKKLADKEYVLVEFKKDKTSAYGKVSTWKNGDDTFVSFSFTNSMIRYAGDRYIDISFEIDNIKGIKVPKSSIAEKELYVIDKSFIVTEEDTNNDYVYCESYDENGNITGKKIKIDIAYSTEEKVYINDDENNILIAGTTLKAPGDTNEHMTIGKTEKLKGVYQYNKGYAIFTPINILYEGKEYCIISSQSKYGLAKYDYIVLNSKAIEGAVPIYQ